MLPDVLQPELKVVFCGTAAGDKSAARGAYYAGPGNRFWPTLQTIGLTPRVLHPSEFRLLLTLGIGLTDIVKCRSGNDSSLAREDFDVGGFRRKMLRFAPKIVAFNGKKAAAVVMGCRTTSLAYGLQADRIHASHVFVLPSTSGAARASWDAKPWRDLVRLIADLDAEGDGRPRTRRQ